MKNTGQCSDLSNADYTVLTAISMLNAYISGFYELRHFVMPYLAITQSC